jgi:hypothetical protein
MRSALIGDGLTHGAADRLEGQPVLSRDLGSVIEGERDDQDRERRGTKDPGDDEQVPAVASALARGGVFPLLLPQRL